MILSPKTYHFRFFKKRYLQFIIINFLELRNTKIYGLIEQKHLEDKEFLRNENLNFCIS